MKKLNVAIVIIGAVSLVVGIVSRLTVMPVFGLESRAFAGFAVTCFLLSLAISNLQNK